MNSFYRCKYCLERMNFVPDLDRYVHLVGEHRESSVLYSPYKTKFYSTSPTRATAWPSEKNVLHEVCVEESLQGTYVSHDA